MRILLLAVVFLIHGALYGQKDSPLVILGNTAWENGEYNLAHAYYEQAYRKDSTKFDVTVKYALALRMVKEYGLAEYYFDKLLSKDRGKKFRESQFHLAEMQKFQGKYHEALRNYKKYLKKVRKDKESYFYKKTKQEINSLNWAMNQRKIDGLMDVLPVESGVNTDHAEFAAQLFSDSVLYFSRFNEMHSEEDSKARSEVYQAHWDSVASEIVKISKSEKHQANVSFNSSQDLVFFVRCDSLNHCQIYQADVIEGEWQNERAIDAVNSEQYTSTMPFFSDTEKRPVLYFVSNRPGGQGGMDIWWSEWSNGEFGNPINASEKVNTPDNEVSPFYADGKLFFSSTWHNGFGGYDVFSCEGEHRSFKEAENIGYPINTALNELYYSVYPEIGQGFFTSNRSMLGTDDFCCNDLYWFKFPEEIPPEDEDSLTYVNLETLNQYLPVTLYFHNDEPDPNTWETSTRLSYLDAYDSYKKLEPTYRKENSRGLTGDKKDEAIYDVEDFFSLFVDKGIQDLEIFSKLLLEELEKGSIVELNVRGFASPRAESDYNVNLTKRRISSMVNYLSEYEGGIFEPFLYPAEGVEAQLRIIETPFGEFQADQSVSDLLEDEQESIYSRGARLERKIEITSVQRVYQDSVYSSIELDETEYDFGQLDGLNPVEHTFYFQNTGNQLLRIDSIDVECGCTVPDISRTEIPPGESATITLQFDPRGQHGVIEKRVMVYSSASDEPQIIRFSAVVD